VNFDEREVAEIKPSSGFGKATVTEESREMEPNDLERVD
jgi:hypothetical protein